MFTFLEFLNQTSLMLIIWWVACLQTTERHLFVYYAFLFCCYHFIVISGINF